MGLFDFRLLSFIGIKIPPKTPWKKYYKKSIMDIGPHHRRRIQDFLRARLQLSMSQVTRRHVAWMFP